MKTIFSDEEKMRLFEILEYNPDSGKFFWKIDRWRVYKGMIAGSDNGQGYIVIRIKRKAYSAHRLAFLYMNGEFPENEIDHINNIRSDNRWCNLREVDHQQNMKNQLLSSRNKSGHCGISIDKGMKKFRVEIAVHGKKKYLGCFEKLEEAIAVRKNAERENMYSKNHGMVRNG